MRTEQEKKDMYGDLTKEEIELVYIHQGNYKGWNCIETGCGLVLMEKNKVQLRAYRGFGVKGWIPQCWEELKQKIDQLEN